MPDLSIQRTVTEDGAAREARYELAGELDAYGVDQLVAAVDDTKEGELDQVVFDLDAIEFCDSAGLAGLVRCQSEAKQRGVDFVISAAPASPVRLLLGLSGLDQVFEIKDR